MPDLLEEDVFTSHPVASRSSHSWHQLLNVAQAQLAYEKRTTQPCLLSFLADVLNFIPWHGHLFSQDVYIFLLYIKTFLKSYRKCCDKGTWAPCCECHCGILCVHSPALNFLVWHKSVGMHEVLKQDSMPAKHWLISKQGFHSLFVWAWCSLFRSCIVPSSSTLRASHNPPCLGKLEQSLHLPPHLPWLSVPNLRVLGSSHSRGSLQERLPVTLGAVLTSKVLLTVQFVTIFKQFANRKLLITLATYHVLIACTVNLYLVKCIKLGLFEL